MKITIKRNEQVAEHIIDLHSCVYPYAIKQAFILSMELDGFTEDTIAEVFGEYKDVKCNEPNNE